MFERITFDLNIMGGRACIRGMRIPVSVIVIRYAVQQYRPYMYGALSQFSPHRRTLTERLLLNKNRARPKE